MRIKSFIGLIVLLCLFMACSSGEKDASQRFEINKTDFKSWAEFINVDQSVMLQTEFPLSLATKCLVGNNRLVFLDYKSKLVYLFDMEGHFISNVGRRGNAKDEYVDISDIAFDKDSTVIKILDRKGILNYNVKDGRFINCESLVGKDYDIGKFIPVSDGHYLFFDLSNDYSIIEYKCEGKTLTEKKLRRSDSFQFCNEHFYRYKGNIRVISDYGNFYIDAYRNDELEKMFAFDFGSFALPSNKAPNDYKSFKEIDESPKYFKCIERVQETDNWLYINTMGPNQTFYDTFINKHTQKVITGKSDMDTALTIIGAESDCFWALLYPDMVTENSYLYNMVRNLKQKGKENPILVKIRLNTEINK